MTRVVGRFPSSAAEFSAPSKFGDVAKVVTGADAGEEESGPPADMSGPSVSYTWRGDALTARVPLRKIPERTTVMECSIEGGKVGGLVCMQPKVAVRALTCVCVSLSSAL